MRVFVAGATGAVGRPLIEQLVADGHEVFGMARNEDAARRLQGLGTKAEIADGLDGAAVLSAVKRAGPEVVINQLTALPRRYEPDTMKAAVPVDRKLRREGAAHLQAACESTGVRRYILQSCAFWYEPGQGLAGESSGFAVNAPPYISEGSRFYQELEQNAMAMRGTEFISLRYGFLYGPGTWFAKDGSVADQVRTGQFPIIGSGQGVSSWVHVEDAARAAVLALNRGGSGLYNIVDDDPAELQVWLKAYARWLGAPPPPSITPEQVGDQDLIYSATRLRGASNAKAKQELDFRPRRLEWLATRTANEENRSAA